MEYIRIDRFVADRRNHRPRSVFARVRRSRRSTAPVELTPLIVPPPRAERARSIQRASSGLLVGSASSAPWAGSGSVGLRRSESTIDRSEWSRIDAAPLLASRRERREAERRLTERGLSLPVA